MLCLSRFVGEKIVVGNNVTIEVLEVIGNKVRLGVTAPRDVPVDREEIRRDKQRHGNRNRVVNLFQGMTTPPSNYTLG